MHDPVAIALERRAQPAVRLLGARAAPATSARPAGRASASSSARRRSANASATGPVCACGSTGRFSQRLRAYAVQAQRRAGARARGAPPSRRRRGRRAARALLGVAASRRAGGRARSSGTRASRRRSRTTDASQVAQTTPPAVAEKPARWSRLAARRARRELRREARREQQLEPEARPAARASRAARVAASSSARYVHSRWKTSGCGSPESNSRDDGVAGARRARRARRVLAQPPVRLDRLRARDRQQVAAALVQPEAAAGRTARAARRSGCASAARPWRSRSTRPRIGV